MIRKHSHKNIWLLLFLIFSTIAHGQDDNTPPLPPLLTGVSVIPSTGFSELWWEGSSSEDVSGYIIYSLEEGEGYALDTIWDETARYYLYTKSAALFFEVFFVVAAIDTAGNISPLSNSLNTMFLESLLDTCAAQINLSWNSITDQKNGTPYQVWYTMDNGTFSLLGETQDTFFAFSGFDTRAEYCFYIQAENEGGMAVRGNASCLRTDIPRAPDWIYARTSVLEEEGIRLGFLPDPQTEIRDYALLSLSLSDGIAPERLSNWSWNGSGELEIELSGDYADTLRYFQLGSLSSCDEINTLSDTLSNLVLRGRREGEFFLLEWNRFKSTRAGEGHYSLIRTIEGASEEHIPLSGGSDIQNWADPLSELIFNTNGHSATYRLSFTVPGPSASVSYSNEVELELPVNIFIPTAFTPDGNMQNEEFRPVLSFTPREYSLQIHNRRGTTVFYSRDPAAAWDGYYQGRLQAEGAYIWQLNVTTLDGLSIIKAGQISLLLK